MTGATVNRAHPLGGSFKHIALSLLPIAAVILSFTRSIRAPDTWAATQALFTCDMALKRCLFGQTLAMIHLPVEHLAVYTALSVALTVLAIALIGLVAVRCRLCASTSGSVILASLAASYGFGVFIALSGSLDVPMAILASAGFLLPRRMQPLAIAVCALFGVLLHEGYLVIFLPVTLLPLVLQARTLRGWMPILAIGAAAFAVVTVAALDRPVSAVAAQQAMIRLQTRADFHLEPYAFAILRRSLADNLAMMNELVRTTWYWRLQFANAALLLPVAALFVTLVTFGWRADARAKALVVWAAFTPLGMNLLGYDVLRWGGLCTVTMALALGAMSAQYGPPTLRSPLFPGLAAMFSCLPLLLPAPYSHQMGAPADVQQILQRS